MVMMIGGDDDKDDVVGDHLVVAVDVVDDNDDDNVDDHHGDHLVVAVYVLFSQVCILLLKLLQLVSHPVLVGTVVTMVTKLMNIFYRALQW